MSSAVGTLARRTSERSAAPRPLYDKIAGWTPREISRSSSRMLPYTVTQGRVSAGQPLDYLLGKVCEMVWEALSSAQSELEPYLVFLRNYLGALTAKAGQTPTRDFALGVLTGRVRQEEDGWPDQAGTEQECASRRQAHRHSSSHLYRLERKHQVEAAIGDYAR